MIIPKHLFADYIGAKSRDAPTNLKPVGTGPYKFKSTSSRATWCAARSTPNYHMPNRPYFDSDRDEGRRRRGLGGARRAADRRVRLRLEPAGRGRDPPAPREGRQGPASSSRRAATSSTSSSTPPIRGPRSTASAPASRPSIRRSPTRRCARRSALLVDRDVGRRSSSTAAPASRPRTSSTTRSSSARRTRSASSTSTRRTSILDEGRLEEGRRRHPREGRQEAEVRLPDLDQPAAPEDPGDRQAGLPEGRHRHRAEVGDGVGVLLVRRRQPRHLPASSTATCRCTRRP